jgi:hypothetical protein
MTGKVQHKPVCCVPHYLQLISIAFSRGTVPADDSAGRCGT